MSFSNIRNDIENAISGTGAEINRCREFWHDEGGTLFEENILNTILSHQKSMREQTEQAENRENGIDKLRMEIESCIAAARTREMPLSTSGALESRARPTIPTAYFAAPSLSNTGAETLHRPMRYSPFSTQ